MPTALSSFNLVIEVLLISSVVMGILKKFIYRSFNLVIEVLLISRRLVLMAQPLQR